MNYPFYEALQDLSQNMNKGNFGLWYNKFIPVKDFKCCKPSDSDGDDHNAVKFYKRIYNRINKADLKKFVLKKHHDQNSFCESFLPTFEKVVFTAKLKTHLVTGIGESHPHEISIVFDHNMGIPYIPSSGIKGIVRFAHTLGLVVNIPEDELNKDGISFDEEREWTHIPKLFGTQAARGSVIFLDAYPEIVPELHVDIMNPHYGKYYNGEKPPADYLDPSPLKFLTVAKGTVFIFRALADKRYKDLALKVKTAFTSALTQEGVGAKTAVGYGLFEDLKEEENASIIEVIRKEKVENDLKAREAEKKKIEAEKREAKLAAMSPEERDIAALSDPDISENLVVEIYNRIDGFSEDNKKALALALKKYWMAEGKWEKRNCSKKQWLKVQKVKDI